MKAFPMFIKTTGRTVVIVGGGEQAAQKYRLLSKTDANLLLCAPELNAELAGVVADAGAQHDAGRVNSCTFGDTAMVFVASGCPGADGCYHDIAKSAKALVNVVDNPPLCDMTTPSIVDRDPVVVAIGTEGTAPVLSRLVKTRIEGMLIPNLGRMAAFAGSIRPKVDRAFSGKQRAFWSWVFRNAPMALFREGRDLNAEQAMLDAIEAGEVPGDQQRHPIQVVGSDVPTHDLLTLRAVACLQEADVVFHTEDEAPAILELPRRDAERVVVFADLETCGAAMADILARQAAGERVAILSPASTPLIEALKATPEADVIWHQQGRIHQQT